MSFSTTRQMSAMIEPFNATNRIVTWQSNNADVAWFYNPTQRPGVLLVRRTIAQMIAGGAQNVPVTATAGGVTSNTATVQVFAPPSTLRWVGYTHPHYRQTRNQTILLTGTVQSNYPLVSIVTFFDWLDAPPGVPSHYSVHSRSVSGAEYWIGNQTTQRFAVEGRLQDLPVDRGYQFVLRATDASGATHDFRLQAFSLRTASFIWWSGNRPVPESFVDGNHPQIVGGIESWLNPTTMRLYITDPNGNPVRNRFGNTIPALAGVTTPVTTLNTGNRRYTVTGTTFCTHNHLPHLHPGAYRLTLRADNAYQNNQVVENWTFNVRPRIPHSLIAHSIAHNAATLTWARPDGANGFTVYVYRGNTRVHDVRPGNVTHYRVTGLAANTAYTFRVVAHSPWGYSERNAVGNFTTARPPLTGIAIGNLPLNNRMTVGDARTLSTSPIPSNATLPGGLVWHSWNTNVATVDQNGRVTAQQTG
ncbi:MAG: fibronectin type III domain-containing protein, partial [Oscillospiraceae bacterium]|nr:fibronectin type III domain-containing protein [Oscillospiraceae bacterium]